MGVEAKPPDVGEGQAAEVERIKAEAKAKAEKAETRIQDLEAEVKRRREIAAKRKKAQSQQQLDLDGGKAEHEQMAADAAEKAKRVEALEARLINQAISQLGADDKARAEKYASKMGLDDFLNFVDDMFTSRSAEQGKPTDGKIPAPPPAAPAGPGGRLKPKGRQLHPETIEVLKRMSGTIQSSEYAKRLLEKDKAEDLKWVVPTERLLSLMQTRPAFGRDTPLGDTIGMLLDAIERNQHK